MSIIPGEEICSLRCECSDEFCHARSTYGTFLDIVFAFRTQTKMSTRINGKLPFVFETYYTQILILVGLFFSGLIFLR